MKRFLLGCVVGTVLSVITSTLVFPRTNSQDIDTCMRGFTACMAAAEIWKAHVDSCPWSEAAETLGQERLHR